MKKLHGIQKVGIGIASVLLLAACGAVTEVPADDTAMEGVEGETTLEGSAVDSGTAADDGASMEAQDGAETGAGADKTE